MSCQRYFRGQILEKIPTSIIGLLSQLFPDRYTQAEIDALFLYSGAPEPIPGLSKPKKIQAWLRQTNQLHADPLKVLGQILDDFIEKTDSSVDLWSSSSEYEDLKLEKEKARINETLAREGLAFHRGGGILKSGTTSTLSLDESVKKHGLASVEVEIKRALAQIENDPHAAAQYAGNVLEASLKAYLDAKQKTYGTGDTLHDLWKLAVAEIGLRPVDLDNKDLRKIATGLNSIVDGIMHLRNKKSGAHGKSEEQTRNFVIKPRHARLAIHSSHTVAAYVLELI